MPYLKVQHLPEQIVVLHGGCRPPNKLRAQKLRRWAACRLIRRLMRVDKASRQKLDGCPASLCARAAAPLAALPDCSATARWRQWCSSMRGVLQLRLQT